MAEAKKPTDSGYYAWSHRIKESAQVRLACRAAPCGTFPRAPICPNLARALRRAPCADRTKLDVWLS